MAASGAPPAPSRVRLVRPSFYRGEATGALAPDVRDLLIGLTTMADDMGWIFWRPAEIAASLYAYEPPQRRLRDLERRVARLVTAGLVVVEECGCAFLPTLKEHHAVKGGEKSVSIWAWHERHEYVAPRTPTDKSVSVTSSSSSAASSSATAPELASGLVSGLESGRPSRAAGNGELICPDCRQSTSSHAAGCAVAAAPFLSRVV